MLSVSTNHVMYLMANEEKIRNDMLIQTGQKEGFI